MEKGKKNFGKLKGKVHIQRIIAIILVAVFVLQPQYVFADNLGKRSAVAATEDESAVTTAESGLTESELPESEESRAPESESTETSENENVPAESECTESELPESEESRALESESVETPVAYSMPSDGSLASQSLKFVNLYWETNDLGDIEAVFDGGSGEAVVQMMNRSDRGIYETSIPNGDYSRVTFRIAGTQTVLDETAYNLYNVGGAPVLMEGEAAAALATNAVDFENTINNTFYYDMGQNPSYWGADPSYEAETLQTYADSDYPEEDYQAVANEGDMVYVVDMAKVENPDDTSVHAAERINIKFLNHLDTDNPVEAIFTMYEQRDGVYTAPFPENPDAYDEIHFQLVGNKNVSEDGWLPRHYNFRGNASGVEDEDGPLWGHFKYLSGYMDTFYLNLYRSEEEPGKDASFWGAHPSRADNSLDTQVLYFDVSDYTENGIQADIDDLWISWKGMSGDTTAGQYDPQKGYKVTHMLMQEGFSYFQFPYNSGATENTILTLTFTLKGNKDKTYTYKFSFVPRSGKNCIRIDYIWEFNGQMWNRFKIGNIEKRTIFFRNKMTGYEEGSVQMRIAGENGAYAGRTELETALFEAGYDPEAIGNYIVQVGDGDAATYWLKLDKLSDENEYHKTNLYSLDIPSSYKYVQFRGKKEGKVYYSGREEISTEFSYPCYYAHQTGASSENIPPEDNKQHGITGFWRSVYSTDTSGDETNEIPTDKFERENDAYYANTTFYDYYSNWEMSGIKLSDPNLQKEEISDYRNQGTIINDALAQYYQDSLAAIGATEEQTNNFLALYLTTEMTDGEDRPKWFNSNKKGNKWTGNVLENPVKNGGPVRGLVCPTLTDDGKIMIDSKPESDLESGSNLPSGFSGVEMPFFNEDFLRGNNNLETAVGNVYKNVLFPFTKDTDGDSRTYGYWVFNSAEADDAMRLSYDVDEGYFLKRTKEPLQFRNRYAFLPFNSRNTELFDNGYLIGDPHGNDPHGTSLFNVDYLFGMQFAVDFTLTDNCEVYNEYTQKDEAIRFEFQGDDDAWIFIDGILALDLGGVHDAVRGEINFKENTYTIWKALKSGNTYEGDGMECATGSLDPVLVEKLKDKSQTHTLTMFYMERGLYESNLKLSFNFPRESTFEVEKKVDVTTNANPNADNIFLDLLENMGGFSFEIDNLVTSGSKVAVEDAAGYLKPGERKTLYNNTTPADFVMNEGAGTVESGNTPVSVTQYALVEGAVPEEGDLLKISPKETMDISDMSYMRLAMKNKGVNDTSARNLYLSFVDADERRVGGYASTLGYEGETNSFIHDEDSVLRIAFQKMLGDEEFDWTRVKYMLVGIRRENPEEKAAYEISSIAFFESLNQVPSGGFSVMDERISDYGSYESGVLTPVDGAWYTRKTKTGDTYDTGISRQTDKGQFSLADGQRAVFSDKFRTGSYISLKEMNVNSKVFDTEWTMLENGEKIDEKYLLKTRNDVTTVENPLTMLGESSSGSGGIQFKEGTLGGVGTQPGDGRKEVIEDTWPKAAEFEHPEDLSKTLVYRSYMNPDTTSNVSTDLSVNVKNILKYGSLTIIKKLTPDMKNKDGKYKTGDYIFDIYYTNVAGRSLESQLTPTYGNERYVRQTVTVHVDESGEGSTTVYNIPAGTTYYIMERPSNGAHLVGINIGAQAPENPHENVAIYDADGNDKYTDYATAYVSGTAYASNQEVIFTNDRKPFYMDVEKIWQDGLTDEARGIDKIYIRLQRRIYSSDPMNQSGWQTVTKDFFDEAFVDENEYIVLTKENKWKMRSAKPLPYEDEKTNVQYEYRIQEIDNDGNLKNYEVSYNEVRNPDLEKDGETYLYVTYQAINTAADIMVEKLWDDSEDIAGVRPDKVRVKLVGATDKEAAADQWQCYKKLLDNDHECDNTCYIELTSGSAWRASVNQLQLTDASNKPYFYKLAQEQIYYDGWQNVGDDSSGYKAVYGEPQQPQGDKVVTISMTNQLDLGNITLRKQDKDNANLFLEDAEFKLEKLIPEEGTEVEKWETDSAFEARTAVTSATGTIEWRGIPYGTYRITEIKAPDGYILLKKPVHVTLSAKAFEDQAQQREGDLEYDPTDKTITVTIKNEKALDIPVTGGRGIFTFTIVGIALCGAAALLYIYRLRGLRRTHHRRKK